MAPPKPPQTVPGAPTLLFAVTEASTANYLMRGQFQQLRTAGLDVHVLSNPDQDLAVVAEREKVAVHPVRMSRNIQPLTDLWALCRILRRVRSLHPAIVHASTPKAALLTLLAATFLRVPHRIYLVRGLRLETARGWQRRLLTWAERATCRCATQIVCVSPSLRRRLDDLSIVPSSQTRVLGAGSSNGVDTERFRPASPTERDEMRGELGFTSTDLVIGFVGRLARDKGLADLLAAFQELSEDFPHSRLLVLGAAQGHEPVQEELNAALASNARVVQVGFVPDVARYYWAMDLLAFPSYREGMPNAVLEANASAVPVVGYDATGTCDAVVHNITGTLVPVGDTTALEKAVRAYLQDGSLRRSHGESGRDRVRSDFEQRLVWDRWLNFYRRICQTEYCSAEGHAP